MEAIISIPVFLASVIVISFSGVMMPGPVFAATVARGRVDGNAGAKVALGHGVIEVPLMMLIYLGFAQFFTYEIVKQAIGVVGGGMLWIMGCQMLRPQRLGEASGKEESYSSIVAGIVTTSANPYFFLWWATIGAALVINSALFGIMGFLLFAVTHWLVDFFWDLFISKTIYKSRRLWSERVHRMVLGACALLLLGFGTWFIISALPRWFNCF